MSNRKRHRTKQNLFRQIWRLPVKSLTRIFKWFLRCYILILRGINRQQAHLAKSGFILPTVAMVTLIVVLLTTALVFRSFDRAGKASNIRVNQAVLKAAEPALDRARAKIDALFSDQSLPLSTPSDIALLTAFDSSKYTLGDETRLKLAFDINGNNSIQTDNTTIENSETLNTTWKFPVDTDNNGKFDSYTLYGIYFRSPSRGTDGKFNRLRNSLEARTPPMGGGQLGTPCQNALSTSASLVGDSGWYKSGSKLKKSFFVYTATVPIADPPTGNTNYEAYTGNKGFSALELQQDRSRNSLNNNAVVFQDDLEITPAPNFNLNGRVFTNANLLIGGHGGAVRLYQVSSKNSCFYEEENGKVTVGGNVGTGNLGDTTDQTAVTVDLFNGFGNNPGSAEINGTNRSTNSPGGSQIGYNDAAYTRRIALMLQAALAFSKNPSPGGTVTSHTNPPTIDSVTATAEYPTEVKQGFTDRLNEPGGNSLDAQNVLSDQIELYLRNRTRRIPFAEITAAEGTGAEGTYTTANIFTTGTVIEPPAVWREPLNSSNQFTNATSISLNTDKLPQTQPQKQRELGKEQYLGDRVLVGNNLPFLWKNSSNKYVSGLNEVQYFGSSINWTEPNDQPRYRTTQVAKLPDLGISGRDGYWEDAAAQAVSSAKPNVGGLRVITGAGIYRNDSSTYTALSAASLMPKPTTLDAGGTPGSVTFNPSLAGESTGTYNLVWSDTMPMTGGADNPTAPPDLRMRATAVYHYSNNAGTNQTPIACVSSYYNPTNSTTAKNKLNIDGGYGVDTTNGRSNNGIVYPSPYATGTSRLPISATYLTELKAQAKLMLPNGRIVNEPLQKALQKLNASGELADTNKPLSLSENSAIDTAICAIRILTDNSFDPASTPPIPHGAIKEATFLNGREVKAIEGSDANPINSDLALEQRQPLEIRVTDINLGQLAATTIGSATTTAYPGNNQEYLLPNSGIIYASRDDALRDASDTSTQSELLSPTDFKLDPTRRPNGIRLINGSKLERDDDFREAEKGLILVTNLPAYIKGNFNLHLQSGTSTVTEEFTNQLNDDWGDFYDRETPFDNNFACRKGQTGCGSNGDQWRPATIIADAVSLQSGHFTDGFRNQGDYDLNNNAGSSVVQDRKNIGFWDNNFVTSAHWTGSDGFPSAKNSYLTSGVSPIQRRVTFPEYLMEVCTKLPISKCGSNDWYVNPATNLKASDPTVIGASFNINTHKAGTTTTPAAQEYRRYPRRLAVLRRTDNNLLILTDSTDKANPIPIGINSSGNITLYPYQNYTKGGTTYNAYSSSNKPRNGTNPTLWYRTSSDANDPTPRADSSTNRYGENFPLQYMNESSLLLPETVCIKKTGTVGSLETCPTSWNSNVANLNLPNLNTTTPPNDKASNYAVCVFANNKGATKKYKTEGDADFVGTCPGNNSNTSTVSGVIRGTRDILDALTSPNPSGSLTTASGGTLTANAYVNVYTLPGGFNNNVTIELRNTTTYPDPVFVLKAPSGMFNFGANSCGSQPSTNCNGVKVTLTNVDPNKVFWILDGGSVKFNDVNTAAQVNTNPSLWGHQIKGTIFGGSSMHMGNNTEIEGRLLGNSNAVQFSNPSTSNVTAIVSSNQPLFIPVLQVHNSDGTPGDTLTIGGNYDNWKQVADDETTFNAAFITGNSPSRPGEDMADLHNFVRFLERWTSTLKIKGSFIQFKRSAYATAPFSQKRNSDSGNMSIFGHNLNSTPGGNLPYYDPPTRQWGFDVALLSYPPDLFAQRFTQPSTGLPDEYMREVSRDDTWVQTLLCAAQGSGSSYSYAVDSNERPSGCPVISSYNDPS
ncbi:hypothetical protein B7486_45355 [cyanobacterium TDX16]|nr:hypothetical protein B7486_45355 [cyanobacterium TDX16]